MYWYIIFLIHEIKFCWHNIWEYWYFSFYVLQLFCQYFWQKYIMNIKRLWNHLQKLGFSEKEAEVYLTLLSIGESSVLQISKSCSVKRATIYNILDILEKKGIVRLQVDWGKSTFIAESPKYLESLIEQQKKELSEFLPELEKLQQWSSSSQAIKFYRGKEAMYLAYDKLHASLKPSDDYLVFGDIASWFDTDRDFFSKWLEKRKKVIRSWRSIFTDSQMAQKFLQNQWNLETRVKIIHSKKNFHAIKLITSKQVFLHKTWLPHLVITIEDSAVVALYKQMFEVLWESL